MAGATPPGTDPAPPPAPSLGIGPKCAPPEARRINGMSSYPRQTRSDLCDLIPTDSAAPWGQGRVSRITGVPPICAGIPDICTIRARHGWGRGGLGRTVYRAGVLSGGFPRADARD